MGKKAEREKAERKAAEKAARKAAEKAERKAAEKAARKAERKAAEKAETPDAERHPALKHLDRVGELQAIIDDDAAKPKARKAAQAELDRLRTEGEARIAARDAEKADAEKTTAEIDAEIKARVAAKREARAAADQPGSKARTEKMQRDVAAGRAARHGEADELETGGVTTDLGAAVDEAIAEAEKIVAEAADEADEDAPAADDDGRPDTDDDGRPDTDDEPAAGGFAPGFVNPSDAVRPDFQTNGNGQYIVKRPADGKLVGYTRTTTYITALEDTTTLTNWKMRILLEGVAAAETPDVHGKADPVTARVRDLVHNRDLAVAKARKADRKGKLVPGQLATIVDGAWGDFKRAMDALADEVFELGGGREAAARGTNIHALCDLYDREGIDAVGALLDTGTITPSDLADVEAYARACRALNLKVVASEQVVVNDDLKVAGRLDRIYMAKLPELRDPKTGDVIRPADARARRYVGDIKTGRVDYGTAKIAQQIRMYAESEAYDLETHERTSHGANRTTGLLIHLPAGSAKCTVHVVDLGIGGQGNRLVGEVRAFRNTGKRAINLKVDVLTAAAAAIEEGAS